MSAMTVPEEVVAEVEGVNCGELMEAVDDVTRWRESSWRRAECEPRLGEGTARIRHQRAMGALSEDRRDDRRDARRLSLAMPSRVRVGAAAAAAATTTASLPTPAVLIGRADARSWQCTVVAPRDRLSRCRLVTRATLQRRAPRKMRAARNSRAPVPRALSRDPPSSRTRAPRRRHPSAGKASTCSRTPGRATSASPVCGTSLGSTPSRTRPAHHRARARGHARLPLARRGDGHLRPRTSTRW